MPARHEDEERVFKAAVKLRSPSERATYLRETCGNDVGLLNRVQALLGAYEDVGDFLETPALHLDSPIETPPISEGPGTVIGRYKLLEKIGEGGMAVVYMAEQEHPIRRKVALKIIKLGMDTRQVIARFEAERQALAMMDHPSIAKVFDAGATETGRSYFVMELVQGVSITEYCDGNSLNTKDRLALFVQVCHAVQHAHQKGIIHRDIKPSNVMVTHHDGKPVPKVIDFGIAKATNQRLTEKTLFTRYAHLIGTPAYMSPEQAELSDLDIDTRTDIYSLGVLLYELLTGTTPFSEEELRKAGYIEMQRVIREQEPVKPSTRIKTVHVAQPPPAGGTKQPPSAGGTGITPEGGGATGVPRTPYQQVRGDLDWIVMKTLEKDRSRRYDTASGLAEDIRRHLEHEPVLARGPGVAYRLRKFLRRHRVQMAAILAIVVVAVGGSIMLAMWNHDRAHLAEAEGFKHRGILSQAREQYAKAEREAALATINPIRESKHVGPEVRLLEATILVDNRQPKEATAILSGLLNERPEVAGAAHSLLARILWESGSPDAQKLQEIEEHRKQAESLLPETAEAYFLRAMTALTVKEQLASLDKALQLDSSHYESRRLRAYTYYASRKYDRLRDDALAMTILRPRDPLGYSLRAAALRELGQHREAIVEYGNALALTPRGEAQHADLCIQRCETLLRIQNFERVIAEAQECFKLWQDKPIFQYYIFCGLTGLGEYEAATTLFRQITSAGYSARSKFQDWCAKYVFDTLENGRSWHPADREPTGAAFLPMVEAEETYRGLAAKGRRVTTEGFSAAWSPDGTKLAFSLGVQGRSGVAIFDPATKETDLLIVPGKDPKWSPDGRYLAFVRDREGLRAEELAAAGDEGKQPPETGEQVWIMNADGTEPRCLTQGSWPSWGCDSEHLYYLSRGDGMLCSLALVGQDAKPKRILACSNALPSVSPDNRQVAYFEGGSLKIKDLASQSSVATCPLACLSWGVTAWSPTGNEVCLGGGNPAKQPAGLWFYDLTSREFSRVLDGPVQSVSWSPNGAELTFSVGAPYQEIWVAALQPGVSSAKVLGPRRTPREHYRDMVTLYSRRIRTDPMDADAYLRRAQQYHFLGQDAKVHRDMRLYSAIVTQGHSRGTEFTTPLSNERVIHGPFGYQVVLSAEERDDGTDALSIAFGQKGRGTMRRFDIPVFVTSLLVLGVLSGVDAPPARAEFALGEAERINLPLSSGDYFGCLSYDGLEMYIDSSRAGGQGGSDVYVLRRASTEEDWGAPENLGALVNSVKYDELPSISADGLTLYFQSDRDYTWPDIYMTTRSDRNTPWGPAVNLGPAVNRPGAGDCMGSISADNLEFYFTSYRSGGYGRSDVYVSRRATPADPWDLAVNLGPTVNSGTEDQWPCLSPDGLLLFFSDWHQWGDPPRPGGYGGSDIWMSRRASLSDPWEVPVNLGPRVNTSSNESIPRISPDGRTLYFWSDRSGGWYEASIDPILDLNRDGIVDGEDVMVLRAHWGQNYPLCDIGPFPWGDGIVDEKDLMVLLEAIGGTDIPLGSFSPPPGASQVPCEVVLSWPAFSSAQAYDVYLGTSSEEVGTADRANPLGVLVSEGQTATRYDLAGLLEFGRTYYWRIDEISEDAAVQKGAVLKFTTEATAYPITTNIIATASSSQPGMGSANTVNGSGLDKNDGHSTDGNTMWLSTNAKPHWIQFEFDQVYALHELWVWNSNQLVEPFLGFGARTVKIEYSVDGITWTTLDKVPEFGRAPGEPAYKPNTTVGFGGVSAKYVKLSIEANWGTIAQTGLAEVRFFSIPVYASQPVPATGRKGMGADTILTWRAGRQAAQHRVYLGTEEQSVTSGEALVATVSDARFDPGPLNLGTVYYWRIDEVNEAVTPSVRQGEVWSFTTREYSVVDDFEGYTDDEGSRIYESWLDGLTNGEGGSQVGYDTSPFAERVVVHGGRQSMPVQYNNAALPYVSEAKRTFSPVQDWTVNGVDTLTLWFRGNPIAFQERAGGSIQISGGGADIWGRSDQFRFAYKQLSGDGSVVAKVHSLTATDVWAKAGVMIRDSMDPASTYAFMFPTPDGLRAFQNRAAFGGNATTVHSNPGAVTLPLWIKVERKGSNFTGYYSLDGQNWIVSPPDAASSDSVNPVRIVMNADTCIGLAVTSHNVAMPAIAEFSDVSFTGAVTGDWQVEAIGAKQPSNDPAPLYVAIEDDAGKVKTITHPDPAAVLAIAWQQWLIPLSDLTSAGVGLTSVKKMTIGVGDRGNPIPGGAGVIYIDDIGVGHPLSE